MPEEARLLAVGHHDACTMDPEDFPTVAFQFLGRLRSELEQLVRGVIVASEPPADPAPRPAPSPPVDHAAREATDPLFLAAIVDSSTDAIVGLTLDGSIETWNSGAERMYGYTTKHALGNDGAMLVPVDRRHELPAKLAAIAAGDRVEQYETQVLCRDGRVLDVSISLSPVLDRFGRVIGPASIAR